MFDQQSFKPLTVGRILVKRARNVDSQQFLAAFIA